MGSGTSDAMQCFCCYLFRMLMLNFYWLRKCSEAIRTFLATILFPTQKWHPRWDSDKWVWDSNIQPNQGARTVTVQREVIARAKKPVIGSIQLQIVNVTKLTKESEHSTRKHVRGSKWLATCTFESDILWISNATREIWNQRVKKNFVIPSKHIDQSGRCARVVVRFSGG